MYIFPLDMGEDIGGFRRHFFALRRMRLPLRIARGPTFLPLSLLFALSSSSHLEFSTETRGVPPYPAAILGVAPVRSDLDGKRRVASPRGYS